MGKSPTKKEETTGLKETRTSLAGVLATIFGDCRHELIARRAAALRGKPEAIHAMRIAMTKLRCSFRFFAPVLPPKDLMAIRLDADWLSGQLGRVRDIDSAIALQGEDLEGVPDRTRWLAERRRRHVQFTRALRSPRYTRLMRSLSSWHRKLSQRPLAGDSSPRTFFTRQLGAWQQRIIGSKRRLADMRTAKRHRLRLKAKRLRYALEWGLTFWPSARTKTRRLALASTKTLQTTLGKLNDANVHREHAQAIGLSPLPALLAFEHGRERRKLLRKAQSALKDLKSLDLSA